MAERVTLTGVQAVEGNPIGSAYKASKAARLVSSGSSSGTKKGDGWWRTAADERALDFAGRFGGLALRQMARYFYGNTMVTTRTRVRYMTEARLMDRMDTVRWAGPVVWPTAAGMQAIGSELSSPYMPSEERMLHRLLVTDNALRMTRKMGSPVVSEREIRSVEADSGGSDAAERKLAELGVDRIRPTVDAFGRDRWFAIPTSGGEKQHWPDYMMAAPTGLWAVEVEIYPKDASRLLTTLRAYRDAHLRGQIQQVLWLVTPDVQALLEGYRTPGGNWADGLLQRLELLPSGIAPDWSRKGWPMVVRPVDTPDEGLRYALDQRVLPPAVRCSQTRWRKWRQLWRTEAPEVPFVHWARMDSVFRRLRRL